MQILKSVKNIFPSEDTLMSFDGNIAGILIILECLLPSRTPKRMKWQWWGQRFAHGHIDIWTVKKRAVRPWLFNSQTSALHPESPLCSSRLEQKKYYCQIRPSDPRQRQKQAACRWNSSFAQSVNTKTLTDKGWNRSKKEKL